MEYVLSLSYGKDSMACFGAIEQLELPLTRVITADVWATDKLSADLPEMTEFKAYADNEIKKRYGITVEHFRSKWTFESRFYDIQTEKSKYCGTIRGFPSRVLNWCNSILKVSALESAKKTFGKNFMSYQGIAADETERLERLHKRKNTISPLELIEWNEKDCLEWCKKNNLLSPVYDSHYRDGCWFCPFQNIDSLRQLRKRHPELWELLLKWDNDSHVTFKSDHTVHDYEKRFALEDRGILIPEDRFRWKWIESDEIQLKLC